MKLHNLIQGSPEWLAYRSEHFNASDAPAMMGVSPYKTRAELLREIHTGIAAEVDIATQKRFDNGHRAEALARPLAEEFIGAELYPVTGSEGRLSSSLDGQTLDETTNFEHKALNNELRAVFARHGSDAERDDGTTGRALPIHHRIQMEQGLLISRAERTLFMASEWTTNDELVEEQHCWYYPDLELRQQIVDGWAQFDKDLATYVVPTAAPAAPVGKAPDTLPALRIEVTGKVTASNLAEFKETALAAIRSVNRDLKTDQDFADATKAVKWCADIEERLKAAKAHALSQTASIDMLFKTIDDINAEARGVRLDLEKLVTRRKTEVKEEAVAAARAALAEHYTVLNAELSAGRLAMPLVDFAGAIKGLRSIDSMQDALDTLLAQSKVAADNAARAIRVNHAAYTELAGGFEFLFADLNQLLVKPTDDFAAVLRARIAEHKQAEAERARAALERQQVEEAARQAAERQRQERLEQERKARITMRLDQLRDAMTALAGETAQAIDAKRNQVLATEPSEDLFGDRVAEAVELRSRVLIALGEQHAAALQREAEARAAAEAAKHAPAPEVRTFIAPQADPAPNTGGAFTVLLGQLQKRIAPVSITAEGLAQLGFPAHVERGLKLYRMGDVPAICRAISAHVLKAAQEQREAA